MLTAIRKYYIKIADYFESNGSIQRKSIELPWCLHNAKNWYRLKNCLCNLDIFLQLYTKHNKFELKKYWLSIKEDYNIPESYFSVIEEYKATPKSKEQVPFHIQ